MMKKKKILHLITGLEIGGTEMMLSKLLPLLQNDFANYVVCIKGKGPVGKLLTEKRIPVYYLKFNSILNFTSIFKIIPIVKKIKPDILNTYLIHADLLGRIIARLFGIKKVICNRRGSLEEWQYLERLDRITRALVDHYTVQTASAKSALVRSIKVPSDKITIVPNGINVSDYRISTNRSRKTQQLGINAHNINITCVGRLKEGKGHKYLLDAFNNAFNLYQGINLLIVGDRNKKKSLKEQIKNYASKNNVYFLGQRQDVKEILNITDIFVLPTLGEGMSNAIMEAMASGVAVITTDLAENKELITNGKTGLLVPIKRSDILTKDIIYLIRSPRNRHEIAINGYNKVKQEFSLPVIQKKLTNLYNHV